MASAFGAAQRNTCQFGILFHTIQPILNRCFHPALEYGRDGLRFYPTPATFFSDADSEASPTVISS
jgi:hypothetical protein